MSCKHGQAWHLFLVFVLLAMPTARAVVSDPTLHYSFDDRTFNLVTVLDQSVHGHNATILSGNMTVVPGVIGKAFGATSDAQLSTGTVPGLFPADGNLSISLWFAKPVTDDMIPLLLLGQSIQDSAVIIYVENNTLGFRMEGEDSMICGRDHIIPSLSSSRFYHVVLVRRPSSCSLYLDSSKVLEVPASSSRFDTRSTRWLLGKFQISAFAATLDEVMLYAHTLSQGDVSRLYNDGSAMRAGHEVKLPVHRIIWDPDRPVKNLRTNSDFDLAFSVVEEGRSVTGCRLLRNGAEIGSIALESGKGEFRYVVGQESATYEFIVSCEDQSGLVSNSTPRRVWVDTIPPTITIDEPDVSQILKRYKTLRLDASIQDDSLQYSNLRIKGAKEMYFESSHLRGSWVRFNRSISLDDYFQSDYDVEFYATDGFNTAFKRFTFEVCYPNWVCARWGRCKTDDTADCVGVQDIGCGYPPAMFDGDIASFPGSSCDYCVSTAEGTAFKCKDGKQSVIYNFTNDCCATTGLKSDCMLPANQYDIPCTYKEGADLFTPTNIIIFSLFLALLIIILFINWRERRRYAMIRL